MFRENEAPKRKVAVNCTITDGGMGDLLCYLVTVNYIVTELPYIDLYIWVPDYLLEFAKNVLPKTAKVYNYTTAKTKYNAKLIGISTSWKAQHTPMRIHPVDFSNHALIDGDLPLEKKNYLKFNNKDVNLSQFNLPEKYVAISVGSTSQVKEMSPELLDKISDYVLSKGYTPVYLGKSLAETGAGGGITAKLAEIDYSKGIKLIDRTSLVETAAIIAKARAFIGMEGGLTHLAGFTDVPMVLGYTFIDPKVNSPIRNNQIGYNCYFVTPEESLGCRYCQTRIALLYEHDFRNCVYKDYLCVKQLTFDKWKEQIDKCIY